MQSVHWRVGNMQGQRRNVIGGSRGMEFLQLCQGQSDE